MMSLLLVFVGGEPRDFSPRGCKMQTELLGGWRVDRRFLCCGRVPPPLPGCQANNLTLGGTGSSYEPERGPYHR